MRHLFVGARRSGRTTRMAGAAMRDRLALMVVASAQERDRLVALGVPRDRIMCVGQSFQGLRDRTVLYVDNAEFVLQRLLGGVRVEGLSCEYDGFRYAPVFDGSALDERLARVERYEEALTRLATMDARSPRSPTIAREALGL